MEGGPNGPGLGFAGVEDVTEAKPSIRWSRRQARIGRGALRQLWRFRLRSGLMFLSGVLGVAGVTVAGSYAASGRVQVLEQIRQMGANVLVVAPLQSRAAGTRARTGEIVTTLIGRDYTAIRARVPGIEASSAFVTGSFLVKHADLSKNDCIIVGVEASFLDIRHWSLHAGQFFHADDVSRGQRVAVVGAAVARDLFNGEDPVGQRLYIKRIPFEVIGVLNERGQGVDAGNEDNQVYIPLRAAAHRLLNVDYYSGLLLSVDPNDLIDDEKALIEAVLSQTHRAVGRTPVDFEVRSQKALVDTRLAASNRLDRYVEMVGAAALAMSGVGILAICWVSVGERQMEIGLRRALGATQRDIFCQFLMEGTVISVAASLVGIAFGSAISAILARQTRMPFFLDQWKALIVAVVAVALNLVFITLPSRRAALTEPVLALRSE
jgi:putative ABC transport system permease protein